ncbi:glycoside hydrolase family 3 protein [Barnesiella sp. WM24]|uniref:beta-glucosidase n=1 Tax=Barnesiella sp. WM24 TaxID=2558278 RepID=UPI00107163A6|nr:glycoside hydrolase family 3 C-terminal domain-containing protein [Barnesiella sp. WM24]TFU93610.1 glycoside hydrolase family 3 protein [Barnesiella sp. WM24]
MRHTFLALLLLSCCSVFAQNEPYRDRSLSAAERAADLLPRLTLEEKVTLMMDYSAAIDRLGIPEYNWWNEALHGVGRAGVATVLPQSIAMAATFDDDAVNRAFDMVSDEARAKYNEFRSRGSHGRYQGLTFWTPNVNIFRDPRWGRGQETYGEDPYLAARMGVAVVNGLQGPADSKYIKTIAGAKHFAVHSGPEWNRHSYDARDIDPRDLRETYLPAFRALVDAGVGQVMCAYNRYEGEPCCGSNRLLTQILRNEWGYDKIIVTDCWAIYDFFNPQAHATHASGTDASAAAVVSGTDLECGPEFRNLKEACEKGLVTESAIDASVMRLLTARFSLGEMDDDPDSPWASLSPDVVDCHAHREIALDMARRSMTLLKNNGILPLPKSGHDIIVMGPNAQDSVMQWGNYNGTPSRTVTILDGIRSKVGDVAYIKACDHVVNQNIVSHFDNISADGKKGLKAVYRNDYDMKGDVVATQQLTTPLNFTTAGATVFAPGVNLENFSALYTGSFTPSESSTYLINMEADDGRQSVTLDGKTVIACHTEGSIHSYSHSFYAEKGKSYEIAVAYSHGHGTGKLRFDIGKVCDYDTDPGDAEVVIFVGGISPGLEGEEMPVTVPGFRGGDRETIELPAIQRELMKNLKARGKKIVFVNCSGSAVALAPEDSICDAILQAWYPGQAGGTAVADVLFGDYNPAGRLPVTFYTGDSQLPDFENYDMIGRTYRYMTEKPLYPFGHGLSYSTFAYSDPVVADSHETGATVPFSVTVTNESDRDGEEVVQLYMRREGDTAGPVKSLCAFRRVSVGAGNSVTVDFELEPERFATFDNESGLMKVVPGNYEIFYGGSSDCKSSVTLSLR